MNIKNILVTGGTGFIGSKLAEKFVESGYRVYLYDIHPNYDGIRGILDEVEVFNGDVASENDLKKFLRRDIDVIIHAASLLSIECEEDRVKAFKVNIYGSFNILENMISLGIKRLVYTSSLAVYGPNSKYPYKEFTFRDPVSFYGVSKLASEALGRYYAYKFGIDFRIARLPTIFGPGRDGKGATVSFSRIPEAIVRERYVKIELPEYTMVPVIYIDDAIDLLYKLAIVDRAVNKVINVGGVILSIDDIFRNISRYFKNFEVEYETDEEGEKIARVWTLQSKIALDHGLDKIKFYDEDLKWRVEYDTPRKIVEKYLFDLTAGGINYE